jgi:hypothetical protein
MYVATHYWRTSNFTSNRINYGYMEVIILVCIAATLLWSSNRSGDQFLKSRSRYDAVPKPPVSIIREYRGEVGDAIHEYETNRKASETRLSK